MSDAAFSAILALWPVCGWVCAFASTPRWMFRDDIMIWVALILAGAIVGPFGVVWFWMDGHK